MFSGHVGSSFGQKESEAQYLKEVIDTVLKAGLAQKGGKLKPEIMEAVTKIVHKTFTEIRKRNLEPTQEHAEFMASIKNLAAKSGVRV